MYPKRELLKGGVEKKGIGGALHESHASLVGNSCLTSAGVLYSEGMQEYWGLNSFQYPQTAADEHEDSHAPVS